MPFYYLDSSVVVKRYVQEPGSAWTRQLIGDKANRIFLSAIALAEVSAAIAICVREGKLTQNLGTRAYLEFNKHIASAEYLLWPLPLTIMQKAAELAQSYPLKGYDAVQVASAIQVAQAVRRRGRLVTFASGDRQTLAAAKAEGMATDNPFDHVDLDS